MTAGVAVNVPPASPPPDRAGQGRSARRRRTTSERREARAGILFASPWLIGMLVFTVGPIVASIVISLTDWSLASSPNFVGTENYSDMFQSRDFRNSVTVTLTYVLIGVPLFQVAGLALALLLNLRLPGMRIFRTILFLPAVLSGVAVAVLWSQLLNPDGPVNEALRLLGVSDPPGWLSSPRWSVPAVVLIGLWSTGTGAIIYLAGLQNVPPELYEVARIDGAGPVRAFFKITLPMITPTLLFTLLNGIIGAFQMFDIAYVLGGSRGGSGGSLSFYLLYLWNEGFRNGRFGYASALAWVFVVVAGVLIIAILKTSNRWVYEESGDQR
ncbi:sugar ABC transporter permease [Micromonospora sp. NPDC049645]|uniref:carbohydrate ABC transporter permease n=1 Tax=Micromonospora sp. NPDC049645 TaxID=3155508 RepID=UPI003412A447